MRHITSGNGLDDLEFYPDGIIRLMPGESIQVIERQPVDYTDFYLCRVPVLHPQPYSVVIIQDGQRPSFIRRWFNI